MIVLIDVFSHNGRVLGGVLSLEGEAPRECLVNDADPAHGWMWPERAAERQASVALARSLVASLSAHPTLLVCPEECAEAVREAAPFVPLRAFGPEARWVGTAPFSGHPAARLADGFEAGGWLQRLRRGVLLEAGA